MSLVCLVLLWFVVCHMICNSVRPTRKYLNEKEPISSNQNVKKEGHLEKVGCKLHIN